MICCTLDNTWHFNKHLTWLTNRLTVRVSFDQFRLHFTKIGLSHPRKNSIFSVTNLGDPPYTMSDCLARLQNSPSLSTKFQNAETTYRGQRWLANIKRKYGILSLSGNGFANIPIPSSAPHWGDFHGHLRVEQIPRFHWWMNGGVWKAHLAERGISIHFRIGITEHSLKRIFLPTI